PEAIKKGRTRVAVCLLIAEEQTKLGVTVPGVMIRWVILQKILPDNAGLFQPACRGKKHGEVFDGGEAWIQGDGFLKGSVCRVGVTGVTQRPTEQNVGLITAGADRYGRSQVADRF